MVIAELRGICGKEGSPLYDHLFEYKLDKTFLEADAEYFDRNPNSLGDIVPIGNVPTYDFPIEVKMSLAQPHPTGIGAMRLLQNEGFIFSGTIDLFDAGAATRAGGYWGESGNVFALLARQTPPTQRRCAAARNENAGESIMAMKVWRR